MSVRSRVPPAAKRHVRKAVSLRSARIVSRFHKLYYGDPWRTFQNTTWLGVQLEKCPLDLWIYQELVSRIRPELIVETGTSRGGSALFLASCMDLVDHGRVITVDIRDREGRPVHDRIRYISGSSVDPGVVAEVKAAASGASPVMVILDADHSRDHVLGELNAYASLVSPGSYLIVEDTNVNGHPVFREHGPGPHEAVEDFLQANHDFARDPACEKFFMSFNPGGYLRRDGD
jgi:cephalosporin hydroxylase